MVHLWYPLGAPERGAGERSETEGFVTTKPTYAGTTPHHRGLFQGSAESRGVNPEKCDKSVRKNRKNVMRLNYGALS